MSRFGDLCVKYGSDKQASHLYGDAYDVLFRGFDVMFLLRILEIGIYKGASLQVLREYFPNAQIWAIDIDSKSVELVDWLAIEPSVTTIQGDQSDKDFLTSLAKEVGGFDIIIDDGSHRIDHQRISFDVLWPFLSVGGIYVIEDLETSKSPRPKKWNPRGLQTTLDMLLEMAKNNVHWRGKHPRSPMISFYREMCAITKMER